MSNLTPFYPIQSLEVLTKYLQSYLPLVKFVLDQYKINPADSLVGDHLGLQVLSSAEFDQCHDLLMKYCQLIHDEDIHQRRNRIFQFNQAIRIDDIEILKIEIFEPKPDADISKLRPGIEHLAFMVQDYDDFLNDCQNKGVPIDKVKEIGGSKFFKTKFINGVEIEFRNDQLGEDK